MRPDHLEDYRKKRAPERTPEPFGGEEAPASGPRLRYLPLPGPRFVVQKHWARNMHFDFRLELDGTLKSWAVPKGPSTHAEEKRLAVHVEDHPLEYADFEGVIPAGNYGAGSVIVWDRGWFGSFKPEDLLEQYTRGKMELELFGYKLRGKWTLVRMGKKDKEWLLLKKLDGAATKDAEAIDRYPESVISGLTVEEMRDAAGNIAATRERIVSLGAPKSAIDPRKVPLTLATLERRPPSGDDWCFEIKYDGIRALAYRDGDEVRMFGRSGEEITARYPEVTAGLAWLASPRFLLDGEIIADDESGRPSFQRLQSRMGLTKPRDIEAMMPRVPVRGLFFDCLWLEGYDLRKLPLVARKELLARVVPPLGPVQRCDHVVGHGEAFLAAVAELGLEGVVAKRLNSSYAGRRTPDWIKVKCDRRLNFVIGGYTEGQGSRSSFGALHVGIYEGDTLVYVTKVGTGFDDAGIRAVMKTMEPLARDTSPFAKRSPKDKGNHWVEPRLVCEVRFTEWTDDGGLRHPTFMGMRPDVRPEDCRKEEPVKLEEVTIEEALESPEAAAAETAETDAPRRSRRKSAKTEPANDAPTSRATAASRAPTPPAPRPASKETVRVTNPGKVFWPADGYTKADLVGYYEAIAPNLLPYLRDRPVVLTRYPDGIEGKSFFQKDAPVYVPDWVRTEVIHHEDVGRDIRYFVLDDLESLRYVANLGTIPLHAWSSRVAALENPDWLILDLDPKEAPFAHVVRVARALKTILDDLELTSFPKTSGATGLHVLLPMGQRYTHEETRTFARLLAVLTVESVPEIATVTRAIHGRSGKVYVDFGQNGRGNTIVAPYSVRPLLGAPASCPLRWDEVNARLDPANYTIRTIPKRFQEMDDPLLGIFGEAVDVASTIAKIQKRIRP